MINRFLLLSCITLIPAFASAATYNVDASHSKISFKVKHLGISYVSGHFSDYQATFSYDPDNILSSRAEAKIKTASIDTNNQKRDDHLRSAEFLDAAQFPEISFFTKEIISNQGTRFKVKGEIAIHGVTKEIILDAEFSGSAKDPWGNERAAFTANASLNRKDFGLTWNKLLETGGLVVGDEVNITLEIEGIKAN